MGRILVHENEHTTVLDIYAPCVDMEKRVNEVKPSSLDSFGSFENGYVFVYMY